jgi:RNA recognition motif-containing protein
MQVLKRGCLDFCMQDAYMPKDASKQSHRGIGFVTFASADPVDHVMSTPHTMNGQELAIDRATPKDKVGVSMCMCFLLW